MRFFLRINFGFRINTGICKKLLRFGAGLSATAVVAPVNFLRHLHSMFGYWETTFDNATCNASNTPDMIVNYC